MSTLELQDPEGRATVGSRSYLILHTCIDKIMNQGSDQKQKDTRLFPTYQMLSNSLTLEITAIEARYDIHKNMISKTNKTVLFIRTSS